MSRFDWIELSDKPEPLKAKPKENTDLKADIVKIPLEFGVFPASPFQQRMNESVSQSAGESLDRLARETLFAAYSQGNLYDQPSPSEASFNLPTSNRMIATERIIPVSDALYPELRYRDAFQGINPPSHLGEHFEITQGSPSAIRERHIARYSGSMSFDIVDHSDNIRGLLDV